MKFKLNGFQMSDTKDGAEAGKVSPSFDLHLDGNKGVNPISFRLSGGLDLLQPNSGPSTPSNTTGSLPNNYPCCTEGNTAKLYVGGTVDEDMGYFISYKIGNPSLEQGFVRIANFLGQGYVGVDLGAMYTADADAVSPNREWFGSPNVAYFGTTNTGGGDQGRSIGYSDTALRLFGNPDYGHFTYDVLLATGTNTTTSAVSQRGSAFGAMGRVDVGDVAGSFRYWNAKTASYYFSNPGKNSGFLNFGTSTANCANLGPACIAPPGQSGNPDEVTQDFIFSLDYKTERAQVDLVYLWNDFFVAPRSDLNGNTYSRDGVRRVGGSLGWIYKFSSRVALGARYGFSNVPGYSETYTGQSGGTFFVPSSSASQYELKFEIAPVQNAKLSLEWLLDTSNLRARTDVYGNQYVLQNKFVLLWDWAI
ncbi:MAG: hypothetical protein HY280_02205 [Nitrospinae bacterium]|nr:hypothetical protein [Nitrospinota bacterium]